MATASHEPDAPPQSRPEMAAFLAKLPALLEAHPGEFAAVVDTEILGAWPTREEALDAAVERAGDGPFMIRQIRAEEPIRRFSRDLG
jgi:hypothetical protein